MRRHDSWYPTCDVGVARKRAAMLADARAFFASRKILEVETPVLSTAAGSDPRIESIEARLSLDRDTARYLQTSPEYCMKRLLCAGYPDIYAICKVFRDGEAGRRHQPEFTMAEWYRLGFGMNAMQHETCEFLATLIGPQRIADGPRYLSYVEAFRDAAGVDPLRAEIAELAAVAAADTHLCRVLGEDRDAWLDLVFSQVVAAALAPDRLTVIHHYPASQAALARICPEDDAVADRFEVFLGSLELANGYVELTDGDEQWRRWQSEQLARTRAGQPLRPLDEQLIAALRHGLPPCAGVAVGVDRLLMINENCDDIRRVLTFAFPEITPT